MDLSLSEKKREREWRGKEKGREGREERGERVCVRQTETETDRLADKIALIALHRSTRCNGMYDCPGKEDETECSTCPGLYRCLSSQLCLLDIHLCDGFAHCPHKDDEVLCNVTCPNNCTCHGLAFTCMSWFLDDAYNYPDLRYLDVEGGGGGDEMVEGRLNDNTMLIHLCIAGGRLTRFTNFSLPNLNSLDLRDNHIACLCNVDFKGLNQLRILVLRDNPLSSAVVHLPSPSSASPSLSVLMLDLTNSRIPQLALRDFRVFPNLQILNMSGCSTQRITGVVSLSFGELRVLDMRGCPIIEFPPHAFRGLVKLEALYGGNYRLCCSGLLPDAFNLHNCLAPSDSLSDCDRLLKDDMHVIFTAVTATLTVIGNVAGIIIHLVRSRAHEAVFKAHMVHLWVSDGVMGVCLAIITVTEQILRGRYLWEDTTWRRGTACHLLAFLSVLASQVSTGILSLVMLNSVTSRCACTARNRFQRGLAHLSIIATWVTRVIVASVTTRQMTSGKREGSEHALCTPLPLPHNQAASPALGGFIISNCVLHVLTAVGEVYTSCKRYFHSHLHDPALATKTSDNDVSRLTQTYIVISKVLGWPIVSLPITAHMSNVVLPEVVPVNIAVFVLPLNAAINPLLSCLAVVMTRRRQAQKARLIRILASRVAAKSC